MSERPHEFSGLQYYVVNPLSFDEAKRILARETSVKAVRVFGYKALRGYLPYMQRLGIFLEAKCC